MGSFVDWAIPCSVVVGIVIGGFAILAAMGYSKANDYREKMETQAKEQQEAIDFGNYMKEKIQRPWRDGVENIRNKRLFFAGT